MGHRIAASVSFPWDLPPIPGVIFAATSMQIPFMNACGINLKCDYVIANFTIVSQITSLHKLPFCVKNSRTFSKFSRSRNWIFLHWLSQWLSSVCVCDHDTASLSKQDLRRSKVIYWCPQQPLASLFRLWLNGPDISTPSFSRWNLIVIF